MHQTPVYTAAMTHGHAPGMQVRAALWLLALRHQRLVSMPRAAAGGLWPLLLPLQQQLAFYDLATAPGPALGAGSDILGTAELPQQLLITSTAHMGQGMADQTWLGLIDGLDETRLGLTLPRGGAKVWQLGRGTVQTLKAGPPAEGAWHLPWPVDPVFMADVSNFGPDLLYLAGDQTPEVAAKHIGEMQAAWGGTVRVFDGYGVLDRPGVRALLPPNLVVLGMAGPNERRAFFLGAQAFCLPVCAQTSAVADPWQIEAFALGLSPFGPAPMLATDAVMPVDALVASMLPLMEHRAQDVREERVGRNGQALVVCSALLPQAAAAAGQTALLIWGPLPAQGTWDVWAQTIASRRYAAIATQVGPHTAFLPRLMMAHMTSNSVAPSYLNEQTQEALWLAATAWLNAQPSGSCLEVLVPSGDTGLLQGRLAAQKKWQQMGVTASLPVIAINNAADFRIFAPSSLQVGAAVASDDIAAGVHQAAPNRFVTKWLRGAGLDHDTSSLFMHPLTRPNMATGAACTSELWSSATLRLALTHNQVDGIFMPGGPLGAPTQTMRSLYAKRPVSLVSALHGLHTVSFEYDIAAFMLNGPIHPYDGFIVPSRCSRTAFLNVWNTLREWLLSQGHRNVPGPVDVAVIPYGVDTGFFAPRNKLMCRQNLGITPHEVVILSFCRIARRFKTCLLPALLALQQLQHRGVHARLIIAGALSSQHELTRLKTTVYDLGMSDSVTFHMSLRLEDKAQLLSAADIFLALSDNCQESHGLAPIEAMAAGLPVVAADWNGFSEVVVHEQTGFLAPTQWTDINAELFVDNMVDKQARKLGFDDLHETVATDVAALTQALTHLVRNKEARAQMGAQGRARACSLFDVRRQGEQVAAYLLAQIECAKGHERSFAPPSHGLLVDRVDQRFSHYPSRTLRPEALVVAGPKAHDAAYRATIKAYIGLSDAEEADVIDEVARKASSKPQPLSAFLGPSTDMLRLMRCLKYDMLRLHETNSAR